MMILVDAKYITDLLAKRVADLGYDILENIEHNLLYNYRRAKQIVEAGKEQVRCKEQAKNLMESIIALRDKINFDIQYVRYKTLVGFNGVFPKQWSDEKFDLKVGSYRLKQSQLFIHKISGSNKNEWRNLIYNCAKTESNDWATFIIFREFLINLSKLKPDFCIRLLADKDTPIIKFLSEILTGLSQSNATDKYKKIIDSYIEKKVHLYPISLHCSAIGRPSLKTIKRVLVSAIKEDEPLPVIQAIVFSVKNHTSNKPLLKNIFIPSVKFLSKRKDTRWIQAVLFMSEAKIFFESMSAENARLILHGLEFVDKINSQEEMLLMYIAVNHPKLVLAFFQHRLYKENNINYEAIPFEFYRLGEELRKNTNLLITVLRKWYRSDDHMFGRINGRFLKAVFPDFTVGLSESIIRMISNGSVDDYDFAIGLLYN